MERQPKYKIGQEYQSRGKHLRTCKVVDILRTYNHAGELVAIRYVTTHRFMGQLVTDRNVLETTIAMALENQK